MDFRNDRKLCRSCENNNLEGKKTLENRKTHVIMSLEKNQRERIHTKAL